MSAVLGVYRCYVFILLFHVIGRYIVSDINEVSIIFQLSNDR